MTIDDCQLASSSALFILHPSSFILPFAAAATRQTVITEEKTIGIVKKYITFSTVRPAKQAARDHAVKRMRRRSGAGRLPSCQASIAASNKNTLTESPKPT